MEKIEKVHTNLSKESISMVSHIHIYLWFQN